MAQTQPSHLPFNLVVAHIESGEIQIPQFQRNFVWSKAKSASLLDSIVKGYPIGTFIFWKTKEQLRAVRSIGGLDLPPVPEGNFSNQVLDGQQRITSLFASIKAAKVKQKNKIEDFSTLTVDLLAEPHTDDPVVLPVPPEDRDPQTWISLKDLVEGPISTIAQYPEAVHERLQQYRNAVSNYNFSVVTVSEAPIEVATEIFTRLNVGGQKLTTFEIMVAKTYDPSKNFDLSEEFARLREELVDVNYGTIPSATVLQTVGAIQGGVIKARELLGLDKQGFIDTWPTAVSSIKSAVEHFRNWFRIPVASLLPYPALIVPFAYFFSKHPDPPQDGKKELLQDFFWRVAMGTWYSRSVEGRLEADLKKIDQILENKRPEYEEGVDVTADAITRHGGFRAGRAWVKGILCLYAYLGPESFANGALVRISNDWLKQANSKNYHHFFPKAWLKKSKWNGDARGNHVANITIVDDYLNKRGIRARAPSDYMAEYGEKNPKLAPTMETHLIDMEKDGVLTDDFELFFKNRCERISKALRERILPLPIDRHAFAPESEEEEDDAAQ